MEGKNMLKIMVLSLVILVSGTGAIGASFIDKFNSDTSANYTLSDSYGSDGSFTISGGKLNITTGVDNTASVMTSEAVGFFIRETLSLDVPGISGSQGVFMMCSTTAGQPDPNGAGTFGFRFRRGGGYARMHLYPGGIIENTLDPDPNKPATLRVKRTSNTDFDYSIEIEGQEISLGSFSLAALSGIYTLNIGAQAYNSSSSTFSFDNLNVYNYQDSFLDSFEDFGLHLYTLEDSYGSGGSFNISGGKLDIKTGSDNTASVMIRQGVGLAIGKTLSLEVPGVSGSQGVFMMCSTTDGQPDPNGAGTFGFRFRRGGAYARIHLYPGGIIEDTLDPDPNKPATLCVKRTSDANFDYSVEIEGQETSLGSFSLTELSGIYTLNIGAQAYGSSSSTFSFDNLQVYDCDSYFMDNFGSYGSHAYTLEDSYGTGGSYIVSGDKLNIITGNNNTVSVMTTYWATFCVGDILSLEVPGVSGSQGVFMMCSTTAGQPDPYGAGTFGFRFRRGGGNIRLDPYPGPTGADSTDPSPESPAKLSVKRTSDTDFDYSITIEDVETPLGSFSLAQLAGIYNLHIGAQAYNVSSSAFSFDNLRTSGGCGDWGYHPMDFNRDCYVNMLDFAIFAGGWLECTMPDDPECTDNYEKVPFSIIILPDTQLYSQNDPNFFNPPRLCSRKEVFTQMTAWIAENAEELNIKFVLHMGDIVNDDEEPDQWINADEAMSILDGVVPYSLIVGNHDMKKGVPTYVPDPCRNTTNFNNTFPYTRYENEPWYGGRMEETIQDGFVPNDDYDNSYHYFQAAGMEFLVLALEAGPTDAMLAWADSVISGHPKHRVILTTHSYMLGDNTLDNLCQYLPPPCPSPNSVPGYSNTGENIWQELVQHHENIHFVFSGHNQPIDGYKGFDDKDGVYQFLCGEWYDGWLKILTFVPQEDKIYFKTYSPWKPDDPNEQWKQYSFPLPGYNTDQYHQYELDYDMD